MDNCGGGGQRLPPDGDEFPAAYQEFTTSSSSTSSSQQQQSYQYITNRDKLHGSGDHVDRLETTTVVDGSSFLKTSANGLLDMDPDKRATLTNYVLYSSSSSTSTTNITSNTISTQKNLIAEKKIEIAAYYPKDHESEDGRPPPLPLTGPPKLASSSSSPKFPSSPNNDLWRQDNMSEKSVKDKIAMFSSQSSLESPLFPSGIAGTASSCNGASSGARRPLSKHKSSDDVCGDDKRGPERTQSSFELHKKSPVAHPSDTAGSPCNGYHSPAKTGSTFGSQLLLQTKSFDANGSASKSPNPSLTRATSFSGSTTGLLFAGTASSDRLLQTSSELLSQLGGPPAPVARTNSLASTFRRPSDDMRKSSLNQLIEQRRKGISKLRGLVIPEKDALPVEQQPIIDLPEIKSRDSILNNQVPRANIQDKWGSQSSLASNASTVSSSVRANNTPFKMPAPKILSSYSPAFKRKSLSVFGSGNTNSNGINNNSNNGSNTTSPLNGASQNGHSNGTKMNGNSSQLSSPASDAPKSLESICSPTRSDYSFEFVSSSISPDNGIGSNNHLQPSNKPKLNGSQQRKLGRNEYDDSDNDSAVSSSQSSISRGFSPPASPVPSDRSTLSSERSYLSSETHYQQLRPQQLILDNGKPNGTGTTTSISNSSSVTTTTTATSTLKSSPKANGTSPSQRQNLKRSSSTETSCSTISSTSTLTAQVVPGNTSPESRRVLKPQSVEAINRKNILASARCRSGREINGSPLIQRKFSDEDDDDDEEDDENEEGGSKVRQRSTATSLLRMALDSKDGGHGEGTTSFVSAHRLPNGHGNGSPDKPEVKIAYIEITENVVAETTAERHQEVHHYQQQQPPPRLPPKRSVIPQARSVPIPSARPPKAEAAQQSPIEASNDMRSWMRAEMRSMASSNGTVREESQPLHSKKPAPTETPASANPLITRNFRSKSSLTLNERPSLSPEPRPSLDEPNDLLTVLTTKSRSRSAIHVEETSYGKLRSPMSLEDILSGKTEPSSPPPSAQVPTSKLPRSQSTDAKCAPAAGRQPQPAVPSVRRSNSTDSWTEEKIFPSKIPSLRPSGGARTAATHQPELDEASELEQCARSAATSKIPTARNLGRRSASVTDMKKVFEKVDAAGTNGGLGTQPMSPLPTHNRFPSLDSSVEESIRPVSVQSRSSPPASALSSPATAGGASPSAEPDQERFGSISSLASSTSLISQQELAQLVEEASLEEPRGNHDVVVVLLHKDSPSASVGVTLAGGVDCETKEISVHRVLSHSVADKEGSLQRGDRILSINGRSVRGLTHRESLAVLKQPRSELVLVVSRPRIDEAPASSTPGAKLRSRTENVETIVEGYETNVGSAESGSSTAWGPALTVSLYKDGAGLGFSLEGGRDSPLGDRPLLIKKIFTGGAAEKVGALRAGDQLLEVNKQDVSRMSRIEAWSLMKKLPDGEVNLLVRHPATKSS